MAHQIAPALHAAGRILNHQKSCLGVAIFRMQFNRLALLRCRHYDLLVSALIARPIGLRCGAAALLLLWGGGLEAAIETQDSPPADQLSEQLSEVVVKAAEPRLVA